MDFRVGDRVVCIKSSRFPNQAFSVVDLVKGREYIIYAIEKGHCGFIVDIGLSNYKIQKARCICGHVYNTHDRFVNASRFRKVEEKKEIQYVKLEVKIEEPCLS